MGFMPGYIGDHRFHVHPDQIFQNNSPDEVRRTTSRIASVVGAYKVILPLLEVIGGAIPHFRSAVGTVNHAGEQAAFARFRSAVTLLTDLLHLLKDFLLDDRWAGVVQNCRFVEGCFPLFLIPKGNGVGLEVDRTACVLHIFENVSNGAFVPAVFIGPVDKHKNSAETHRGPSRIINWEIAKDGRKMTFCHPLKI